MNYAIETTYVPNLGKGLYPEEYESNSCKNSTSSNSPEKPDSSPSYEYTNEIPYVKNLVFPASTAKPHVNLFTGDAHYPFADERITRLICNFKEWLKPDSHIRVGDYFDFYQLSKFSINPLRSANLQSDIDTGTRGIKLECEASPDTDEYLILGNHCHRLQRFLWDTPKISQLRGNRFDVLTGTGKLGVKLASYEDGLMINDVYLARHGELIRKYSGWTAKAHYEKHGGNGIVGHSHRGGHYTKRDRFGVWGWAENFCLCDLNPEYVSCPDWQHGFTIQTWFSNHQYIIEQIPIINYRFIYGGKVFD